MTSETNTEPTKETPTQQLSLFNAFDYDAADSARLDNSRVGRDILSDQQKKILLKEMLDFEGTFYLELVPCLLQHFLGVKPMWTTGRAKGDVEISSEELYSIKMRFYRQEDAEAVAAFLPNGRHFKIWDGYFKRYDHYWEGDLRNEI